MPLSTGECHGSETGSTTPTPSSTNISPMRDSTFFTASLMQNGACYIYHASGTGVGEWPEGNVLDGCRLDLLEMLIAYVDGDKICKLEFHMDTTILNEQIWGS